jgi:hypothetical protein
MSGSGSTVFGLFQERSEALAARDRLSESGYRVILTESLSRRECARYSRPVAIRRRSASAEAYADRTESTNPATKVD